MLALLMPSLLKGCPPGCPSPNSPERLPDYLKKEIRLALHENLETSICLVTPEFAKTHKRYNEILESIVLADLQGSPGGENGDVVIPQALPEESRRLRRCAASFMTPFTQEKQDALRGLVLPAFSNSINTLSAMWNGYTNDKRPCVHTLEATWRDSKLIDTYTNKHARELVQTKADTEQEQRLPPIDSLLEKVQNLVATRKVRGKPWNRPRECRTALQELLIKFNRMILSIVQGSLQKLFHPLFHFFDKLVDGPSFLIHVIRADQSYGGYNPMKGRMKPYTQASPHVPAMFQRIVDWLIFDSKWLQSVKGEIPPPVYPTLPPPLRAPNLLATTLVPLPLLRPSLPPLHLVTVPPPAPLLLLLLRRPRRIQFLLRRSRRSLPANLNTTRTPTTCLPSNLFRNLLRQLPLRRNQPANLKILIRMTCHLSNQSRNQPRLLHRRRRQQANLHLQIDPIPTRMKCLPWNQSRNLLHPLRNPPRTSLLPPSSNNVNGKAKLPNSNGPTPTMTGAAAQAKLKALQKDRARLEKEITLMEKSVEQLRGKRRATDKDLFRGEYADHIAGFPGNTRKLVLLLTSQPCEMCVEVAILQLSPLECPPILLKLPLTRPLTSSISPITIRPKSVLLTFIVPVQSSTIPLSTLSTTP